MRAHQIENGVVINTIVVDSLDFLPNLIDGTDGGIGWTWDGTTLTAPPAPPIPIPAVVTRKQARKALAIAGLFDAVQPAIDAIADPLQRRLVQIDWDDAASYERTDSTLLALASGLGLDEAALDALFLQASTL